MRTKLPTIETKLNEQTGQIETIRGELEVDIDTSFLAHLKWEEQFGKTMGIDLTTYTEQVEKWLKTSSEEHNKANFLGFLKLLYCYVNSPALPTFKDFCKLFDYRIAGEILEKIKIILNELNKTVSKNF